MAMRQKQLLKHKVSPIQRFKYAPYELLEYHGSQCRPIYHYDEKTQTNYIFIIGGSAIIKYNLDKQIIATKDLHHSPFSVWMDRRYGCLDPTKNIIYLITGLTTWVTYNLSTRKWNGSFYFDRNCETAHFKFIPTPINQLHFTMDDKHYRMNDTVTDELSRIELSNKVGINGYKPPSTIFPPWYSKSKSVYNRRIHEWMIFQPLSYHVLVCKIHDKNQTKYEWRKSDIIELKHLLPKSADDFEVVLWPLNRKRFAGELQLLFIFHLEDNFIECIDLSHGKVESYALEMSEHLKFDYVIADNNDCIHLLKVNMNDFSQYKPCHCKVALFHLIPEITLDRIRRRLRLLIDGFCREFEQKQIPYAIPAEIIELIFNKIDIKDLLDLN